MIMVGKCAAGYSKAPDIDSAPRTNVGTPAYTPPEMLSAVRNEGAAYDGRAIDVWSAGIILFYMLFAHLPFDVRSASQHPLGYIY